MPVNREQLNSIVARAFPGEKLKEVRTLTENRYVLVLAGGEQVELHTYHSVSDANTAIAALRLLRAEIDLPIPQLRAADSEGETIGQPYALVSLTGGAPLIHALPRLTEEQLYDVGRRLGETAYRIHRLAQHHYGPLVGNDTDAADDERTYVLIRLKRDLASCDELGLLNPQISEEVRQWFEREFYPVGRQAALVHSRLTAETILIRQIQGRWTIGGLVGWEHALGWSPAWEHVNFLTSIDGPRFFALRVGYGNAYDENTKRTYEQVREHVLGPYRVLIVVRRLWEAGAAGESAETERYRDTLLNLLRWLSS